MADDSTLAATASILQNLGTLRNPRFLEVKIPGANTPAKLTLENEIMALILRVQDLESKAFAFKNVLPATPSESATPSAFADVLTGGFTRSAKAMDSRQHYINSKFVNGSSNIEGRSPKLLKLANDELIETLQKEIADQAEQIKEGKSRQQEIEAQMIQQAEHQQHLINQYEAKRVASLERELKKHQQANEAFQKALREIGEIITAVAKGDLSKKVQIHSVEMDPEITTFKRVINTMMDQLQIFSSEVPRVAREVGTEGILGGQAQISGVDGTWKELTDNGALNSQAGFLRDNLYQTHLHE